MVGVTIDDGGISVPSQLGVYPKIRIDSCLLQWELSLSSSLNPIRRIERYLQARNLASDMEGMLSRLGSRLEDQRHVYGMVITEGNTTDSLLVSTVRIFDRYPSDSAIYVLVERLRQFIARNGGLEAGYPMLNVTNQVGGMYKVEVGLPTNKEMKGDGDIRWIQLVRVKFLEADVRGGDSTVRKAVSQMANYIGDYQRTIMGIPYQSLITDRMKEQDTTKWMTRLYVPIYPLH
jgi:effector-binding domain-containing protein